MVDKLAQPRPFGTLGDVRGLVGQLVPPGPDVRDTDAGRKSGEHRSVVERVTDVDVLRQIIDVSAQDATDDELTRTELVEVWRTEVDVHARSHRGQARLLDQPHALFRILAAERLLLVPVDREIDLAVLRVAR